MDRNAQARKRAQGAQTTSKPPIRIVRDKRPQIRTAKDSSEIIRVPRRAAATERPSADDDPNARNFTVANVGRNGLLYLKPTRMPPGYMSQAPATPPGTSDGQEHIPTEWANTRQSSVSGTWTPRAPGTRSIAINHPLPPLSMANVRPRRRTRSHSFSTVDNSTRSPTFDSTDFQLLLNGRETARPKSSIDLTQGMLDLRIPHYKLGTPRFSDQGTAYLHNSIFTATTEDLRSSLFSRADYDKLFPAPPGREPGSRHSSSPYRAHSSSPYMRPSHAVNSLTPSPTPPTPPASLSPSNSLNYSVFDTVEAHVNDATLVRYSPSTGRITAATPARLIAQITSPLFLDYELLADFFLTFRSFLPSHDLLEYLLARMKWALANNSDAGRIVQVRTFVAIRHWILNYFADDFLQDLLLRQRFCSLVNELVRSLRQRPDRGGTDMNVLGELKKCWRRTCARFWPAPDALDTSPDVDILPGHLTGQDPPTPEFELARMSLPLAVQRRSSHMDFRRSSVIQLPGRASNGGCALQASGAERPGLQSRSASIPASPMSEDSMTVLSCSIPFLRAKLLSNQRSARPPGPQRNPALPDKAAVPGRGHGHKRSGSFTDALRDKRPPLPSGEPESVDLHALQGITFTGGLVRGLLLQPSPSKVSLIVPLSPGLETREQRSGAIDAVSLQDRHQAKSSKKLVGDVRRVLSSRKEKYEGEVSSHRSANSSDSSYMSAGSPSAWLELRGPERVDMLGEKIEGAYKEVFQDMLDPEKGDIRVQYSLDQERESRPEHRGPRIDFNRMNSHVTTGSRSIVIANDTGVPDIPRRIGGLPSVSSWASASAAQRPLRNAQEAFDDYELDEYYRRISGSPTAVASEPHHPGSAGPHLHDVVAVSDTLKAENPDGDMPAVDSQARKSSSVHPSALNMPPVQHQLRRRPGGDLKAADNVHDLEPTPKHFTGDSYSTFTQPVTSSGLSPNDLSGTHFSGQWTRGMEISNSFANWKKDSIPLLRTHSSQPNMPTSFEAQVSHLTQLPDHPLNGSIEDALARLEGKPPSASGSDHTAGGRNVDSGLPPPEVQGPRSSSLRVTNVSVPDRKSNGDGLLSPQTDRQGASICVGSDEVSNGEEEAKLPEPSPAISLPLQGLESDPEKVAAEGTRAEVPARPPAAPKSDTTGSSFLLDDNESLSDISTEIADHSGDESFGVRSFFFDDTVEDDLVHVPTFRRPPTPPSTVGAATSGSPEPHRAKPQAIGADKKTLKEAASAPKVLPSNRQNADFDLKSQELRRVQTSPSRKDVAHLPFVLAFESDVIAEQMTIIEKDALDEVEWKDLVSLNWQQNSPHVRNWVDFLKEESNGIDIVVARFNLVVKWAVSECLLTEVPSERARCITKYIHIANHCHRLRNYASMYQITLALRSADMARLHQTWALVPASEKQSLDRLEKLCQPLRNFHNLRSEMESAPTESEGCIPFIGLYTHDLMYNAQKPARIDPMPPGKEKLINFERYQTAAAIVKGLLRLIESSAKYVFRPHPEVLSRCLWLAALEDGEITTRSRTLEA
ncbi:Guanine nucleotide exchange factor lte1 [Vermiconidia calcicola]|uniref:Guanine nucleotide exchange factor lte1 n=1 Tax=Vermiconidia calcicola TaxID=1690605 RepID=A0ACC3NWT0_9PEZI|nr:Guanine nucleotide exchange factor lte1 [Vermiconidia calcicola]